MTSMLFWLKIILTTNFKTMTNYQNLIHPEFSTGYGNANCRGSYSSILGNFGQWVGSGFESKTKRAAVAAANAPDPSIGLDTSASAQKTLDSTVTLNPLQFDNYTAPVYTGGDNTTPVATQPTAADTDIFSGTTAPVCDTFKVCTPTLGTVMPGTPAPAPAATSTSYTSLGVIAGVLVIGLTAFGIYKWHKKKK